MTDADLEYIRKLLAAGIIRAPVLELGAGYGGDTCREAIVAAGLDYKTTDMMAGPGVDFVADFEKPDAASAFPHRAFGSVLVLNVLEHVFEPITVLDTGASLVRKGGTVITCTPCMWPVHNYPRDHQRLLPDWFVTYAERRPELRLLSEHFEFVGRGAVAEFERDGERHIPPPWTSEAQKNYARVVHRVFNTSARGQWGATHVAIGAVFERA